MINIGAHKPWIKLAQLNVLLGEQESACTLLSQAADYEPKQWEIWKDLAALSVECGHFEKAAHSYGKILKLNPTYKNEEVLKAIVTSLINGNLEEMTYKSVSGAAYKLLSELNNNFPRDIHYCALLGVVSAANPEPSTESRQNSFKLALKSVELFESPTNNWYKFDSEIGEALKTSQLIVDCLVNIGHLLNGSVESLHCLKMAHKFINHIAKTLDEYHSDFLTASVRPIFLNHYDLLLEKASKIQTCLP